MTAPKRQQGVALIMVLMITGILGLLMLQIGLTAREHVARAQKLLDRAEATLRLQSRESAMVYSLLTQEWISEGAERAKQNPYAAAWNFRGDPFEIDGARYRIQDVNGLFQMPQPGDSMQSFERLLEGLGIDKERAERVGQQLKAFQEYDREVPESRRIPLQAFGELRGVVDLTQKELLAVQTAATLYPSGQFNPATASGAVLASRYQGTELDAVRSLRVSGRLDAESLGQVTEQGADEFTGFYPGPALRFDIRVEWGGIALRRESTWIVRPHEFEPLALWSRRQMDGAPERARAAS